jgi:paraquat-inducible protein B
LQSLLNGLKGNQPGQQGQPLESNEAAEKARQEAQNAQRKIADELDKLIKKYAKSGYDQSAEKRLDELSREAHRLDEMLSNPRPDVRDKQNQFLTRMLQSALSMNKRDETKEDRKSEMAKNVFSEKNILHSGNEMLGPDAFYMLKRRALQGVFPESYRSAVNTYFDSLGVIYLKNKD